MYTCDSGTGCSKVLQRRRQTKLPESDQKVPHLSINLSLTIFSDSLIYTLARKASIWSTRCPGVLEVIVEMFSWIWWKGHMKGNQVLLVNKASKIALKSGSVDGEVGM